MVFALINHEEDRDALEEYWRNIYLRSQILFDPSGSVGLELYDQALRSTPTGTAFVIDASQRIALPLYGYNPTLVINTIHELLGDPSACKGDTNADGAVDPLDSGFVLSRLGCPVGQGDPLCDSADANLDGLVDPLDVGYVLSRFGPCP